MNLTGLIRLLAVATIFAVGGTPAKAGDLPPDVMPLSEVKAGMKGEAFSVVHGFELSRYEVEILGIERGGLPGTDMILATVEGPGIGQHGIVAGMSGSPVYIDGKIIGAVAYGFQFAYRPIAGITPIEAMLPLLDILEEPASASAGPVDSGAAGPVFGWDWRPAWDAYSGYETVAEPDPAVSLKPTSPELVNTLGSEPLKMVPLSAPFYVSGLTGAAGPELKAFFAARGLSLMPMGSSAGSNEAPDEPSPPMVAGSALAIPIMTGDLTISAVGTATYRSGNKILAFGHPGFSRGDMNAPMAQASIIAYMQSYALSFKLAESRELVGSVTQDRRFGIGGVFGESPPRIGIKVNVSGGAANPPRSYTYSMWEDRDFSPMFAMVALSESIGAATGASGQVTGECTYRIRLADGREIVKTDRSASQGGLGARFARPLMQDMFLLLRNPYEQADVESIEIDVRIDPGYGADQLLNAEPRYDRLESGDPLEIETRWRPYRGAEYDRPLKLELPDDLKPGIYVVHLADANTSRRIDQIHNRGKFRPRNFDQIVEVTQALDYPDNEFRVYCFEPALGLSLQGEPIESIPGSIQAPLARSASDSLADPVIGRLVQSETFDSPTPMGGSATFLIEVAPYLPR